jgi:hypothetical protein
MKINKYFLSIITPLCTNFSAPTIADANVIEQKFDSEPHKIIQDTTRNVLIVFKKKTE